MHAGEPTGPQRIIALAPSSAEVICALGACERIVGVGKFCNFPPDLATRPQVGGLFDPDLEKIIALRPDLIVLRGNNDSLTRLGEELKVPIHRDGTESLADIESCLRAFGERLDRRAAAEERLREFRAALEAVRRRVADRARPRVLLTVSRSPDRLGDVLTAGRGTFLSEAVEIAGGQNVFGNLELAYPQVSGESILAQRPEVIIEFLPELALSERIREQLLDQWRGLGDLPAVQSGRVYFLTDDHCLIPSPRFVTVIEKVSYMLHPGEKR
ncbi:MAG: ABC transporter substrate-binding protein [Planctomycetes bacterium]|nr:ABC transporter substrate-binding protein [Planctomycetota bacterium]